MFKKVYILLIITALLSILTRNVLANTPIDNGINYLKSKQDLTGKITGFGGESEWAALGLSSNGLDINSIKVSTSSASLKDFLLSDQPNSSSPATDWERKILAIVAIHADPTNFNGVNYIQKLESFYNNNQIGDINLLNDDIFGLLSLIAGNSPNSQIKQNVLNFIISHQNNDGGFSWSTNSSINSSDSNDTAATLQALEAAKNNGLTNTNLDTSITQAKNYLFTTQKNDGGFGYDTASDSDGSSTSWALQTLNVLGQSNSQQAVSAKTWLLNNQENDGGFHYQQGSGSDTYTTSHILIALSGKGWLLNSVATPSASLTPTATPSAFPSSSPTPTPSPDTTSTPSPSPAPIQNPTPNPTSSPILTTTPSPTLAPSLTPIPTPYRIRVESTPSPSIIPSPIPEVLGTNVESANLSQKTTFFSFKRMFFSLFSLTNFIGAAIFWKFKI